MFFLYSLILICFILEKKLSDDLSDTNLQDGWVGWNGLAKIDGPGIGYIYMLEYQLGWVRIGEKQLY